MTLLDNLGKHHFYFVAVLFVYRCVRLRAHSCGRAGVRACVYIYRISTLYNRLYNIYTV